MWQVWEKLGTGYMRFGGDRGSPLGYIVENRVLTTALAEDLEELQGTRVRAEVGCISAVCICLRSCVCLWPLLSLV